jgi:hypothetical protein
VEHHGLVIFPETVSSGSERIFSNACIELKPQSSCYIEFVASYPGNFVMEDPLISAEYTWTHSGLLIVE